MAAIFTNEGIDLETRTMLNKTAQADYFLVLYTDNTSFVLTDTYATHTQLALPGGAAVDLVGSSWSGSTSSGLASYTYPTVTLTLPAYIGAIVTIYGYFVYRNDPSVSANKAIFGDVLPTPYPVPNAGGAVTVDVTYRHQKCA